MPLGKELEDQQHNNKSTWIVNACTEFCAHPANRCWDILVCSKATKNWQVNVTALQIPEQLWLKLKCQPNGILAVHL